MVPHICEMDELQRLGDPRGVDEDGPKAGSCWNCQHMVEVYLGGKTYQLCVKERDISADGEVKEASPDTRDCEEWDEWS